MQRINHQFLQQTASQKTVSVEHSFQSPVLDDGQQSLVSHNNNSTSDGTSDENTGYLSLFWGDTDEVSYGSKTQGASADQELYSDVQPTLNRRKCLWANPQVESQNDSEMVENPYYESFC